MCPTKFRFICPSSFRGKDLNVKSLQTTDAFRPGEPIISSMFYEICEYMYQFCLISISIYHTSGFFPRGQNFAIFFEIGGFFLAVFNFHDPQFDPKSNFSGLTVILD